MAGLLDYIFYNLAVRDLDRSQIEAYTRYLDEIIRQGLPPDKESAFLIIKNQLLQRLAQLKQEQISFKPPTNQEPDL